MRRIINSTFISLDGVIENPHHWPPLDDGDAETFDTMQTELLFACDAVLMGRRTYDSFAAAWPTRSGDPFSDRINAMTKYVVSSTLQDPEWNSTDVISGDLVANIKRLKEQPGKDIVQYGFGQVSYQLLLHGLLDELRLWVYPLFIGSARPQDLLFREGGPPTKLRLVDTKILKNGIVVLSYQFEPANAETAS